jgi:hypothetical protein
MKVLRQLLSCHTFCVGRKHGPQCADKGGKIVFRLMRLISIGKNPPRSYGKRTTTLEFKAFRSATVLISHATEYSLRHLEVDGCWHCGSSFIWENDDLRGPINLLSTTFNQNQCLMSESPKLHTSIAP